MRRLLLNSGRVRRSVCYSSSETRGECAPAASQSTGCGSGLGRAGCERCGLTFQHCITSLCNSSYSDLGLQLLTDVLSLQSSSYWLVRTELLETLAEVDFR